MLSRIGLPYARDGAGSYENDDLNTDLDQKGPPSQADHIHFRKGMLYRGGYARIVPFQTMFCLEHFTVRWQPAKVEKDLQRSQPLQSLS